VLRIFNYLAQLIQYGLRRKRLPISINRRLQALKYFGVEAHAVRFRHPLDVIVDVG
jgi:hypothetical protein